MTALATAFACVWAAVALYVGWLWHNQRRLAARVQQLTDSLAQLRGDGAAARQAA